MAGLHLCVVAVLLIFFQASIESAKVPQHNKVTKKHQENENVMEMLQTLQTKVNDLEKQNAELRSKVQHLESSFQAPQLSGTNQACKLNLETNVQGEVNDATINSLFAVRLGGSSSIADNDTIIWDIEEINAGGHYNVSTGVYTVPYTGVYQFSVSKSDNLAYYHPFILLLDDEPFLLEGFFLWGTNDFRSCMTASIYLNEGQTIAVRNRLATGISTQYSWFTGYLYSQP